ncbi:MAG: flavodoxin [Coprobacillus sp.]
MKIRSSIVCVLLLTLIVGCGRKQETSVTSGNDNISSEKILIAYFTFPETDGVDASSSASRAILDNKVIGSTEYMAKIIQANTSGDLFVISTEQKYPSTHEPLVEQASKEKENKARPTLKDEVKNFADYDTVFIGYPNWWGDMPMSLYTFLEKYDFTGKTVIPFNTHGGSGFSKTIDSIKDLEPSANVIENGLSISRNNVTDSKEDIVKWVDGLNLIK